MEEEASEYAKNFIAKENAMRIHIGISKLQELDPNAVGLSRVIVDELKRLDSIVLIAA